MANFGEIYKYVSSAGIVLPDTNDVKTGIENAFKEIFGEDFSVEPSTPNGVLIAALTKLFTDVIGVNAQNANGFNLKTALGNYLDGLGQLFGVQRAADESDTEYRRKILNGQSRGYGYVQSIVQAISNVGGVQLYCVFENGYNEPMYMPPHKEGEEWHGVTVPGHSIFVSVLGGNTAEIAQAIYNTKSAGCGYTTSDEYGTPIQVTIEDTATDVYFYRPQKKEVSVSVTASDLHYTGVDIVADVRKAISRFFKNHAINCEVNVEDLAFEVMSGDMGIQCKAASFIIDGIAYDKFAVTPYQYLDADEISENSEITIVNG